MLTRGPARRQSRRRLAARRGDHRRLGDPRRLQRQAARARGRLEVPASSPRSGSAFALLGIVLLAPARRAAALDALSWRSLSADVARGARRRSSLPPGHRRPRREDRLGAGPQLAARRPLRGAAAGLRAPLGGAPARGAAGRLARRAGARDRRSASAPGESVLIGFGLVSLAVAIPFLWRPLAWKRLLAYSSLEHMGVIALGHRLRDPARPRRRRRPHRRARAREGARLLRRDARCSRHEPRAAGHPSTGDRTHAARPRRHDRGHARRARRAPTLAALRQRDADRRRRLPGRAAMGCGGDAVLLALGFLGLATH